MNKSICVPVWFWMLLMLGYGAMSLSTFADGVIHDDTLAVVTGIAGMLLAIAMFLGGALKADESDS